MTLDRPARIGNCSGYYGDRLSAFREMLEGGDLDYLTGDYLAELTMLILGKDQMKDPSTGYAKTFVRQLEDGLALALEKGVKVVTNAGGLNPAGLAERIREIATAQGLDVHVAHVEGDDLKARAAELDLPGDALTVNAYLGAFGIAAALEAGADVVVTGRVTDASVVMGPAIHAHGWGRDDLDALAGALVAGHVIECGTQATGGNFSGFRSLDTSAPLGFPIAEVAADGSSVVTKHAGVEGRGVEGREVGGAVTVDTVTAQLVYEIQGPAYLNPDVVAHLDTVELTQDGPDRVRIAGVRGTPPPATTKVCLNLIGGFRNSVELLLTGLDIEAKAAWVRRQVTDALQSDPPDALVWTLDRTDVFDPPTQAAATSLLRCVAKSTRPEPVGRTFSDAFVNVALASYPGFTLTAPPGRGAPFGVYRPAYVPQSEVPHVVVHPDGTREEIAPPTGTADPEQGSSTRPAPAPDLGDTRAVPLGELVHARSGDKGGDANVGLWVPAEHPRRDDAVAWLLGVVNPGWVQAMLPEAADLDVDVHPLPNLGGVNIVIHGLLGEGVSSSTRLDPQAKALGEWLRARVTAVPLTLLEGARP
ncbi:MULTISPECIES: acyclic terpene utilization AtuA family protein [unclassified Aeromicrobium]|uniref:acyclic terpene utilization AtuA family protein n=1 Tax=unclassified Aeromicrobium TaxID=2633570 RepID=UPI0006FF0494|nr:MULTISPECIES: acyclic terpene utilization AtuA family protein [unclassified Aeromicrobium]KQP28002.1 exopolyphosphatase [Aeromicrobium sp. Leaf272]KQP78238.1 exopolyphosphatase [Aeromicrobium sp. Leaf289]